MLLDPFQMHNEDDSKFAANDLNLDSAFQMSGCIDEMTMPFTLQKKNYQPSWGKWAITDSLSLVG